MLLIVILFFAGFVWLTIELDRASIRKATKKTEEIHREYYKKVDEIYDDPLVRSREKAFADKLIRDTWREAGVEYQPEKPLPKEEEYGALHPDELDKLANEYKRKMMRIEKVEEVLRPIYGDEWREHYDEYMELLEIAAEKQIDKLRKSTDDRRKQ